MKNLKSINEKLKPFFEDPNYNYGEKIDLDIYEAQTLIEDILDTLIEVGNGVTEEQLYIACQKLFCVRDCWFNKALKKIELEKTRED